METPHPDVDYQSAIHKSICSRNKMAIKTSKRRKMSQYKRTIYTLSNALLLTVSLGTEASWKLGPLPTVPWRMLFALRFCSCETDAGKGTCNRPVCAGPLAVLSVLSIYTRH